MKKFFSVLLSVLLLASPCLAVSTDTCFDTDTVTMLHMDGADASTTFTDEKGKTWTANGNAQIDTAQSVFGGASGLFDGTGDYLETANNADFNFLTGKFTLDFWVRFNVDPAAGMELIDLGGYLAGCRIAYYSTGIDVRLANANYLFAWAPSTGTWYHIAMTRDAGANNLRVFIDGTLIGSAQTSNDNISTANTERIAAATGADFNALNGWLDEVRIVKGTAVWTSNFTRPSAAYTQCGVGSGSSAMMQFFED